MHLDDARELRRNPIVAAQFARVPARGGAERRLMGALRAVVAQAAENMLRSADAESVEAERMHAIVTRCDLHREKHKDVARDLRISLRQFYRARAVALEAIAEEVALWAAERAGSAGHVHVVDALEIALRQSSALRLVGRYEEAVSVLEPVARAAGQAQRAVYGWCGIADALTDGAAFERASTALGVAEQLLEIPREERASLAACARVPLSRARLCETRGDIADAREAAARCAALAQMAAADGADVGDMLAWAALMHAAYDIRAGSLAAARRHVEAARDAIETTEQPEADLVVEHLIRRGELASLLPLEGYDVTDDYNRAAAIAERHGYALGAMNAVAMYASHLLIQGDVNAAAAQIAGGLSIASLRGTTVYAAVELIAAEIACAAGDAQKVVAHARSARASLAEGSCDWGRSYSAEAQGYFLAGDHAQALAAAFTAVDVFRRAQSDRYAGSTMCTIALCFAALGRTKEAQDYIADSIEKLEASGHPYSLRRSLAAAATISAR